METRIKPLLSDPPELPEIRLVLHRMVSLIMGIQCPLETLDEFVQAAGLAERQVQEPLNEHDDVPSVADTLATAEKSVKLLTDAIVRAQRLARHEDSPVEYEPTSIRTVLRQDVVPSVGSQRVSQVSVAGSDGWILMNRPTFAQALTALVSEAVGDSEDGGNAVEITVTDDERAGVVELHCLRRGMTLHHTQASPWESLLTDGRPTADVGNAVSPMRMLALHDGELQIHYSDEGIHITLTFPRCSREQSRGANGQ